MPVLRLNVHHDYMCSYMSINEYLNGGIYVNPNILIMGALVRDITECFLYFKVDDLRLLCAMHGIHVHSRNRLTVLYELLKSHDCSLLCRDSVFIFKIRHRERSGVESRLFGDRITGVVEFENPHREARVHIPRVAGINYINESMRSLHAEHYGEKDVNNEHLMLVDHELRQEIICEWQDATAPCNVVKIICAVCARKIDKDNANCYHASELPLTLLRNDELPSHTIPDSYNFEAYHRAILHPAGLMDCTRQGDMIICFSCEYSLMRRQLMPKYALANWLYYGHDRLPLDVKNAFASASRTELTLISRAKSSKICFRFTDFKERPVSGYAQSTSQRCNKGNVIVVPQDATCLLNVIPATPEVVADMLCVVFVGGTKPTRNNIEILKPLLVSKSRVKKMIYFLLRYNPYYQKDGTFEGFSQANLDALLPGRIDEVVPPCIEIGQLPTNAAIEGATSGYVNPDENYPETDIIDGDGLIMENVGFVAGDNTPMSIEDMKIHAVSHCRKNGLFIQSQAGNVPVPDFENEGLLSWLFPYLDPWGIGGFYHPRRKIKLSLDDQLRHLLCVKDSRFEQDPNFAFVYYNIRQKRIVYDNVRFKVPSNQHQSIVRDLLKIDVNVMEKLGRKYKNDSRYEASTEAERDIVNVLAKVNLVGHKIPGTTAYKLTLRNEIRAAINYRGAPTLFVTLNPSDVHNPLVRILAGEYVNIEDLVEGQEIQDWRRSMIVAKNPASCAIFFDLVIRQFIHIILRYGRSGKGLFGKCLGYYGTVETQGRGSLHCHMLIWLSGHPSPQVLRDRMQASEVYKHNMFRWLESVIKCELLGTTDVVCEYIGKPLPRPSRRENLSDIFVHPGVVYPPRVQEFTPSDFEKEYVYFVNALVKEYNWHKHTDTCFKYCSSGCLRGEEHDDKHCRMGIDGHTRPKTELDEETFSILLRRLHPRIASYNDLVVFLLQCNMDIKFIGSGEAAKAFLCYVTDYITKSALPTHVGLAALIYAIKKTHDRFPIICDEGFVNTSRSSMITVVNSMMARQEMSHQQVMSYLVGGGDHYSSDDFRILYWTPFDSYIRRALEGQNTYEIDNGSANTLDGTQVDPNVVILNMKPGSISATNQCCDYIYRCTASDFECMCLYDFIGGVDRVSKPVRKSGEVDCEDIDMIDEYSFSNREHPQFYTHTLSLRKSWLIPVILGKKFCRPDGPDSDNWARSMLILFKPWRGLEDLKADNESWTEAYEIYSDKFEAHHLIIMQNMNVLTECKEARDICSRARVRTSPQDLFNDIMEEAINNLAEESLLEGGDPHATFGMDTSSDLINEATSTIEHLDVEIGFEVRKLLDQCFHKSVNADSTSVDLPLSAIPMDSIDNVGLDDQRRVMGELRKRRRPEYEQNVEVNDRATQRIRTEDRDAILTVEDLNDVNAFHLMAGADDMLEVDHISDIESEMQFTDNEEQARAFRIIGQHVCHGQEQLLMYIAGIGGTGKSHIIRGVVRLFERLGRRGELLLSAPTGTAAQLIGGYTIHALIMLGTKSGKNRLDFKELRVLWKFVRYLIIDEVSMVSGYLLSQISNRIRQAKGEDINGVNLPFGGVNIIFIGDFGQLRPVLELPLYSYKLVHNPTFTQCRNVAGVSALDGAFLWRQVRVVVKLEKNQRQGGDSAYAHILARLRTGNCMQILPNKHLKFHRDALKRDIDVLRSRELSRLAEDEPDSLQNFNNAPIIVGNRRIRDAINARFISYYAKKARRQVDLYYSKDCISKRPVTAALQEKLWKLSSSASEDVFGRIPLFIGMKVMVTSNLAFSRRVVNGAEGTVEGIVYDIDSNGRRYVSVVYVRILGAGTIFNDLGEDVVPIFPESKAISFKYIGRDGKRFRKYVSRLQVPLIPAYCYTDYKSQGRSLDYAIVDIRSARSLQGVYVMLSRVKRLKGLAILRWFPSSKICQRLSEELREEFDRVDDLNNSTKIWYIEKFCRVFEA
jgi:Helitron helicase-like domain at N-terminus/PIF1-like helicase